MSKKNYLNKLIKPKTNKKTLLETVAIVVPVYKKDFSESEKISMKHLLYFLKNYDKYFIVSKKSRINHPEFEIISFNNKYFKSIKTYSKLLLTQKFYKKFKKYKYILIYQLDALVFSDQLLDWCNKNYDYIGAPWINSEMKKVFPRYNKPDCCGNGGFSLRNVKNCIKVLNTAKQTPFNILGKSLLAEIDLFKQKEKRVKKYLKIIKNLFRNSSAVKYKHNEDIFWSFEANKYYPDFKIPPPDIGLKFAFEVGPKYCFEKNKYQIPFGCHAWKKYDKKFWLPYLLTN